MRRKDHKLALSLRQNTIVQVALTFKDRVLADYAFKVWITQRILRQSILPKNISRTAKLLKYKVVGSNLYLVIEDPNMTNQIHDKIRKSIQTLVQIVYNSQQVNQRLKHR